MHSKFTRIFLAISALFLFALSCSKSDDVNPNPDPCAGKTITVTATPSPTTAPGNSDGSITVSATGSSGFTYSLNTGAYQASGSFTGLAAGTYTANAKDADGCIKSQTVTISATACPTITVTATITPTSSSTATNGVIAATATGSAGFTYSLNGGAFQASGTFNNLAVGTYTVAARDLNGCTGSQTFTISAASCPTISVTGTSTAASGPTATNGAITAAASGGTAPYTFSLNGGASQSSNVFSNLSPGNYTVVATDANGCSGTSATVTVSSNCPTITASTSVQPSDKCTNNTGTISVTASGSTGFTYSLNGGTFQASNNFNGLAQGAFTITVRDGNGCTANANANIAEAPAGTRFSAVKAVMLANCATSGCHSGASPQSGINLGDDCTIVSQAARIKARAVDGTGGFMPPGTQISAADKTKITEWINNGGQHSNN